MKKLNDAKLKVGDIILTSGSNWMSRKVRKWTNSDISHAMIYVATCSVMDSTGEGVHSTNTQRIFFEDEAVVVVLRYKEPLPADTLNKVTDYARAATGTGYSKFEAASVVTGKFKKASRRQFCSRLVGQAYAYAGIKLVSDPDYCSPENLRTSPELVDVDDVLMPATEEEKAFWESRPDIPRMMAECTNKLMASVRKKSKSIHSVNDIHSHLMHHPEDDEYFKDALEKSGYMTIWQRQLTASPWQYDFDLMKHVGETAANGHEQLTWYCRATMGNPDEGRRYEINAAQYPLFAKMSGSETLALMADLYERLDGLHKLRIRNATRWLRENPSALLDDTASS